VYCHLNKVKINTKQTILTPTVIQFSTEAELAISIDCNGCACF